MTECVVGGQTSTTTFLPSGLRNAGRITVVTVNNLTWTALPPSVLAGRNAISIQNRSGQEVKLQYDPATAGYVGVILDNDSERFYDITDAIQIYAKSMTSTVTVTVEELS